MDWKPFKDGLLAESKHGYYIVEREFHHEFGGHRWFVKYEADNGGGAFREQGDPTGLPHGYQSLEDAQAFSEQNAHEIDQAL
jgi:hypothetical protein